MRHGRTLGNRISKLHERFRIIFNEKHSSFQYFFYTDRFASIQTRNLRIFASETFKDPKEIAPSVFANILIAMAPENFSPHYQSGFQMSPGKTGI